MISSGLEGCAGVGLWRDRLSALTIGVLLGFAVLYAFWTTNFG